jgi:hypothetical protein
MQTVALFPAMAGAKYDKYKEAWYLLRGETPEKPIEIKACAAEEPVLGPRFFVIVTQAG